MRVASKFALTYHFDDTTLAQWRSQLTAGLAEAEQYTIARMIDEVNLLDDNRWVVRLRRVESPSWFLCKKTRLLYLVYRRVHDGFEAAITGSDDFSGVYSYLSGWLQAYETLKEVGAEQSASATTDGQVEFRGVLDGFSGALPPRDG